MYDRLEGGSRWFTTSTYVVPVIQSYQCPNGIRLSKFKCTSPCWQQGCTEYAEPGDPDPGPAPALDTGVYMGMSIEELENLLVDNVQEW